MESKNKTNKTEVHGEQTGGCHRGQECGMGGTGERKKISCLIYRSR